MRNFKAQKIMQLLLTTNCIIDCMNTIAPRTLKGFRDFLPSDMRIRTKVIEIFKTVFEKYGYEPLETPTLEYADILLGKYGDEAEKLLYHFTDRGGREVAMKYDLTVPACRVLAQYQNDIPLPFKRYQIQPVWRADNTQKGRFRELYQCDADTFGSSSVLSDAEYIQMGLEALQKMGFTGIVARISNRKFIDGLVLYAGASQAQFSIICTAIDKLDKIGIEGVQKEMKNKEISEESINKITEIISIQGSTQDKIAKLRVVMKGIEQAELGLSELEEMFAYLKTAQVNPEMYIFDLAIVRGLSYYTGPVWEFMIKDGDVGSVGGGGRYDKLVGLYLGKDVPATGGSFGIERIIEIVKDRKMFPSENINSVLVTIFDPSLTKNSLALAQKLRSEGKSVILYPDALIKLEKQLKYANKKGIEEVYILGPEEVAHNQVKIKNMKTGNQTTVNF